MHIVFLILHVRQWLGVLPPLNLYKLHVCFGFAKPQCLNIRRGFSQVISQGAMRVKRMSAASTAPNRLMSNSI